MAFKTFDSYLGRLWVFLKFYKLLMIGNVFKMASCAGYRSVLFFLMAFDTLFMKRGF